VGLGQTVGIALCEEPGVSPTVVADGDGTTAEMDDLDPVGLADQAAFVVVVASMSRVDRGGGHQAE
jgi:hypothetical protein